ncbi:protein MALE DISCOVERER 2-like isoform X2 [Asparagus officinalis]|uniref:protein MALE DISCOVERER 2-like isoform X2 n=1 Tax=Asparagus officinalis TaxID=4686 RepID=UPI00098E1261|nr:protein MALE DISCOVERER 2-like isoform X2 [Asparagus officinalis]
MRLRWSLLWVSLVFLLLFDHCLSIDGEGFPQLYTEQEAQLAMNSPRRKLLQESSNLPAAPVSSSPPQEAVDVPSIGSGAFPAVPNSGGEKSPPEVPTTESPSPAKENQDSPKDKSDGVIKIVIIALSVIAILGIIILGVAMLCRHKGPVAIVARNTGLSGQLKKAFVAGVPKLDRTELEAACEDFSNIIHSYPFYTVYKGILSSGVEIAVISTTVASQDWSKHSEAHFRKKVDILSRVNHKNFVNLLGYCVENEPFMRMMTFEYSANGTLYEHLHSKEFDHLDWSARMRIIMGTAYCLQYIQHEVKPPVVIGYLNSKAIFLTDDYAAKVCELHMWSEIAERKTKSPDEDKDPYEPSSADPGSNIYSFGIMMLEIISGKVPESEEEGSILNWATEYLNDRSNFKKLVDPALKTSNNDVLELVCEVVQECIHGDPKDRPNIKEITSKLKEATGISPEAAQPRHSPLWWAELEILSVEAS